MYIHRGVPNEDMRNLNYTTAGYAEICIDVKQKSSFSGLIQLRTDMLSLQAKPTIVPHENECLSV
jgi:hypothetical protein